jgi:hypothetical protein
MTKKGHVESLHAFVSHRPQRYFPQHIEVPPSELVLKAIQKKGPHASYTELFQEITATHPYGITFSNLKSYEKQVGSSAETINITPRS